MVVVSTGCASAVDHAFNDYAMFGVYFQRVLVLVAYDVDALCACKIVQVGNILLLLRSILQ